MNYQHILKTLFSNSSSLSLKWNIFRNVRLMCSEPAAQVKDIYEYKEKSIRPKRIEKRKPKIEPFARNLFTGKVNTDIFPFPEILNKEELHNLKQTIAPIENAIDDIIRNGSEGVNLDATLEILKKVDAFAINVPVEYGGLAFNVTETCRYKEVLWKDVRLGSNISSLLGNGLEGIVQFGTDEQKHVYLPRVCAGNCTPKICFVEPNSIAMNSLLTKAKFNSDKNIWTLNGDKIIFGPVRNTDLLIVFATTSTLTNAGEQCETVTAFLVDSNLAGIVKTNVNDSTYKISFTNVEVKNENILGKQDSGMEIAFKLTTYSRMSSGIACSVIMKELIDRLSKIILNSGDLINAERVQEKIAEMAYSVYATESMIYLTAGLLDGYEDPDCSVETGMLKIFSTEECLNSWLSAIHIIGAESYLSSPVSINDLQNVVNSQLLEESNDYLKLLIGMFGLQQAGMSAAESVKKIRNPLMYPGWIFKRMITHRGHSSDNPKLILRLSDYVHPSLTPPAEWLEYCILRLHYIAEMILSRHGAEIIHKQMEVNKIAIAATEIYAMFATISRASRSYCIGLQNAHYEIYLATCISKRGMNKVKAIIADLETGPESNDDYNSKLANQIYKNKGYFAEHPLAINF